MLNLAFRVRGLCLANKTGHLLADHGTNKNSKTESALLRGGTHHTQHGASDKKDGSGNIHDEVVEDAIELKSIDCFETELFVL